MRTKGQVALRAEGYSMYPYIRPGDVCHFSPLDPPLRAGQIGLVVSERGVLFSHRLIKVNRSAAGVTYCFRGDLNRRNDEPVGEDRIIGVLTALSRKGSKLDENRRARRIWSWLAVRFRLGLRCIAYVAHAAGFGRNADNWNRRSEDGFRDSQTR
jgi:hypothetical protein